MVSRLTFFRVTFSEFYFRVAEVWFSFFLRSATITFLFQRSRQSLIFFSLLINTTQVLTFFNLIYFFCFIFSIKNKKIISLENFGIGGCFSEMTVRWRERERADFLAVSFACGISWWRRDWPWVRALSATLLDFVPSPTGVACFYSPPSLLSSPFSKSWMPETWKEERRSVRQN